MASSVFSRRVSVSSVSSFVNEETLSQTLGFDVRQNIDSLVTEGFCTDWEEIDGRGNIRVHKAVVDPDTMLFRNDASGAEIQLQKRYVQDTLSEVFGEVWDSETKEGTLVYPGKECTLTAQQAACAQAIAWGSSKTGVKSAIYSNFFMMEAKRLHKEFLAAKAQDGYTSTPRKGGTHALGKGVSTSLGAKLVEKGVKAQA